MPANKVLRSETSAPAADPRTLAELLRWIHHDSGVSPEHATRLVEAIQQVFAHHELLWQQSKEEALQVAASVD